MNVVMRTTLLPAALSGTIERVVREVDAAVPVVRLRDMDSVFAESIRRPRLLAQLLGAFAGLALILAAIGTYGVLSYMVTERRREIGIRIALGAVRSHVLTQIMKQGLQVTAMGITIGLAGALALNLLIASLLFGVQPTDTVTIASVIATITAVAVVASWLPALPETARQLDGKSPSRTSGARGSETAFRQASPATPYFDRQSAITAERITGDPLSEDTGRLAQRGYSKGMSTSV
jgi:predicted lysophospholipase L1 biosynthesis ABC-type transport system permease subunit